jgi:hypothetical protein
VYAPSSIGAGVDSFDFSASFAFGLAFANDLNKSLVALSFLAPDFESLLLSVVEPAEGCGVERPDVLSSDALPLLVDAEPSLSFAPRVIVVFAAGFVRDFAAGLDEAVGGAYFAVLLYSRISATVRRRSRQAHTLMYWFRIEPYALHRSRGSSSVYSVTTS